MQSTPCPPSLSTASARPLRSECPDCCGTGRVREHWFGGHTCELEPGNDMACPTCAACDHCLTGDGEHVLDEEGTLACSVCLARIRFEEERDGIAHADTVRAVAS